MFIANIHTQTAINNKAASIGSKAGLCGEGWGAKPGLIGNTFEIKDDLRVAGARWDGANKAWYFQDWAALEAALDTIIAA